MPVRISGAVAADAAIANALQPPTRGVGSPGTTAIPSDWLSRCLAGQVVPGCTYHLLEGTTLQVSPTVQTRIKDDALVASLGLNQAQVDAFKARIAAGTYVATPGTERVPNSFPRKVGVSFVPFQTSSGAANNTVYSLAQQQATLNDQKPAWWHNFQPTPEGVVSPAGTVFVPMLLQTSDYSPAKISAAVANAQGGWIMGQGEPDMNGTPLAQAIINWGTLVNDASIIANPQIKLVSPYPAGDQSAGGSYLQQFMAGITSNGNRLPDAIAFDRYAPEATILTIVANYHAAFPSYELWIPEYAIDSGVNGGGASQATQAAFMQSIAESLDKISYVTHHAIWYNGPATWGVNNFTPRALYDNAAAPTALAATWKTCGRSLPI